ncbi:hypothetical protein IMG5_078780 [Ichthyophthirius multifiliis]|uniref:Uncharacterized protein n=1 Tax=Ichthyophthirius multifiliis TaxID=5932 RepID=G0QQG8_ICHMU|nr:hypothetical protein IMG5_078780 [Ichthyophthirius multifiliis]EGR32536.1 hypothetical protein IMG5_078780 [Ichthyophthirius multifiliis]|eukprot:XP_004036522.1 hypothetical protein IMG5_078780 [Ichthyophthirius multifiliis]
MSYNNIKNIIAIKFDIKDVSKTGGRSKLLYSWQFLINQNRNQIDLAYSIKTGKYRLFFNKILIQELRKQKNSKEYYQQFQTQDIQFLIKQTCEFGFEIFINGLSFQQIQEQESNNEQKKKNIQENENQKQHEINFDQATFYSFINNQSNQINNLGIIDDLIDFPETNQINNKYKIEDLIEFEEQNSDTNEITTIQDNIQAQNNEQNNKLIINNQKKDSKDNNINVIDELINISDTNQTNKKIKQMIQQNSMNKIIIQIKYQLQKITNKNKTINKITKQYNKIKKMIHKKIKINIIQQIYVISWVNKQTINKTQIKYKQIYKKMNNQMYNNKLKIQNYNKHKIITNKQKILIIFKRNIYKIFKNMIYNIYKYIYSSIYNTQFNTNMSLFSMLDIQAEQINEQLQKQEFKQKKNDPFSNIKTEI